MLLLALVTGWQSPPIVERQWVIKEIQSPPPSGQSEEATWGSGLSVHDLNLDGATEYALLGSSSKGVGGSEIWTGFRLGFVQGTPGGRNLWLRNASNVHTSYSIYSPLYAVCRIPGGTCVAVPDLQRRGISRYDLLSGSYLGTAVTPAGYGSGYIWAGDMNADGQDELFVWSSWGGLRQDCMIDGRSGSMVWSQPLLKTPADLFPIQHNELLPTANFNQDAFPDQVSLYGVVSPGGQYFHHLRALSGVSGSLLWAHECAQPPAYSSACTGMDFTDDAIPDLILANGGAEFEAIDGAIGSTIWRVPQSQLHSWIPPGYTYQRIEANLWLGASPVQHGQVEIHFVLYAIEQSTQANHFFIGTLDAATGAVLHLDALPPNQAPWDTENLQDGIYAFSQHAVLGDTDRDGLKEVGRPCPAPDDPFLSGTIPHRWAVLGLKTWFVADQAQVGATVTGVISIPSAPDHHFNLLLSTGFDASGGVRIGNWKTHLAPDSLLSKTITDRPFTGRLGPDGQGSVSFQIPNDPGLIGQTLYSKVAILTPGNPSEVWTLSTLGLTQLIP